MTHPPPTTTLFDHT